MHHIWETESEDEETVQKSRATPSDSVVCSKGSRLYTDKLETASLATEGNDEHWIEQELHKFSLYDLIS